VCFNKEFAADLVCNLETLLNINEADKQAALARNPQLAAAQKKEGGVS
jgi:hypothetical protein